MQQNNMETKRTTQKSSQKSLVKYLEQSKEIKQNRAGPKNSDVGF